MFKMSTLRTLVATILIVLDLTALHSQSLYPPIKQNLTEPEQAAYLIAMRKAWIEVDELSDAKPMAACFIDHLQATTPFTLVDQKTAAEVVLRFFTMNDLERRGETAPHVVNVTLTVLLLNDEVVWQGTLLYGLNYRGPATACGLADQLAADLRDAMRKARAQK